MSKSEELDVDHGKRSCHNDDVLNKFSNYVDDFSVNRDNMNANAYNVELRMEYSLTGLFDFMIRCNQERILNFFKTVNIIYLAMYKSNETAYIKCQCKGANDFIVNWNKSQIQFISNFAMNYRFQVLSEEFDHMHLFDVQMLVENVTHHEATATRNEYTGYLTYICGTVEGVEIFIDYLHKRNSETNFNYDPSTDTINPAYPSLPSFIPSVKVTPITSSSISESVVHSELLNMSDCNNQIVNTQKIVQNRIELPNKELSSVEIISNKQMPIQSTYTTSESSNSSFKQNINKQESDSIVYPTNTTTKSSTECISSSKIKNSINIESHVEDTMTNQTSDHSTTFQDKSNTVYDTNRSMFKNTTDMGVYIPPTQDLSLPISKESCVYILPKEPIITETDENGSKQSSLLEQNTMSLPQQRSQDIMNKKNEDSMLNNKSMNTNENMKASTLSRTILIPSLTELKDTIACYYQLIFTYKLQLQQDKQDIAISRSWFNGQYFGMYILVRYYEDIIKQTNQHHYPVQKVCSSINNQISFQFSLIIGYPTSKQWSDFCQYYSNLYKDNYLEIFLPPITDSNKFDTLVKDIYMTDQIDLLLIKRRDNQYLLFGTESYVIQKLKFLYTDLEFVYGKSISLLEDELIAGKNYDQSLFTLYLKSTNTEAYVLPSSPLGTDAYLARLYKTEMIEYIRKTLNNPDMNIPVLLATTTFVLLLPKSISVGKSTWKRIKEYFIYKYIPQDYVFNKLVLTKKQDTIKLRQIVESLSQKKATVCYFSKCYYVCGSESVIQKLVSSNVITINN